MLNFKKDPLSRIEIKYKLPLSFIVLYFIVFGIGGYFLIDSVYKHFQKELIQHLKTFTFAHAIAIQKKMETFSRRTEDFASDGFIRTMTEKLNHVSPTDDSYDLLKNELNHHLSQNKLPLVQEFVKLEIRDSSNQLITAVEKKQTRLEIKNFPLVNKEKTDINALVINENTLSPVMIISTPLYEIKNKKNKIGYLISYVDVPSMIIGLYENLQDQFIVENEKAQIYLLDGGQNGVEINAQMLNKLKNPLVNIDKLLRIKKEFNWRNHLGTHICSAGIEKIGYHYPLLGKNWTVLVEVDKEVAFSAITTLQSNFLIVVLIISLATIILLYFPIQFIVRPLGELKQTALKIKEGDFSARVKLNSEDEIGDLANTFNLMAEAIEERTRNLENTTRLLQASEKELRLERDRLKAIVSSMKDGVILLNEDGDIVLHNAAAENLLGYLNENLIDVSSHCRSGSGQESCDRCLLNIHVQSSCVLNIQDRIYEIVSTKLIGDENSWLPKGKILVARDITEREKMNMKRAFEERLAMLGKVAAVVAHEMNSPLAAISMFNQMLEEELPKRSKFREHVDVIKRNTLACQNIVKDLLEFARNPQTKNVKVDIHQVLDHVIHFLNPVSKKKNISVQFRDKASQFHIMGDPTNIQQVFTNILLNAIQAVQENEGIIHIETNNEENKIRIVFTDNGPGIPEEMRKQIFEPFFTTKKVGGTGLGLFSARRIVEAHGGTIELVSGQEGNCKFQITFPLIHMKQQTVSTEQEGMQI